MYNDIQIGPFTIHGYGLMCAIGLLSGYLIAEKRAKKKGFNTDLLLNLFFACMIGCLVGGKTLYCIVEYKEFLSNPAMIFDLENGFVIYGGLIGGFIGGWYYCKKMFIDFLEYFEMLIPSLPWAHGIGRIGCFMAGCCHGRPTDAWYGIAYINSTIAPNGIKLIPTQLISCFLLLCLSMILFYLASKKPKPGILISVYMILYSIGRFMIEFLRSDSRGNVFFLSTSQFIAIFTLLFGIYLYKRFNKSYHV